MATTVNEEEEKQAGMSTLGDSPIGKAGLLASKPAAQPLQTQGIQQMPQAPQTPQSSYKQSIQKLAQKKMKNQQKFVTGGLVNENGEEDDEQQLSGGMGASVGGTTPGAPAPAAAQAGAAPQGSGSFVNLKQYIEAGKPATERLSNRITSGFQKEAGQLREQVAGQRETSLGAGSQIAQEQQRLEKAEPFIQQQIAGAGQDPNGQNAERFGRIRQAVSPEAQAPELQQQRASAADLERRAQSFGTSAGRQEELSRTVGKRSPSYTAGQRGLDALLLGGDRSGRIAGIKAAREATSGLGKQVGQLESDVQGRLTEQATERQRLSGVAETGVEQAREALRGTITGRQAAQSAEQSALQQRLEAAYTPGVAGKGGGEGVASRQLSQADLASLGLSGQSLNETYGLDPRQFLNFGNVSNASVATAEEQARLGALAQLAGQSGSTFLPQGAELGGAGVTGGESFLQQISQQGQEYGTGQESIYSDIQGRREQELAEIEKIGLDQPANTSQLNRSVNEATIQHNKQLKIDEMEARLNAEQQQRIDQLNRQYQIGQGINRQAIKSAPTGLAPGQIIRTK